MFSSFKITPAVRVIAGQLRDKNCPGAIFAPGHQDVSQGPLGRSRTTFFRLFGAPALGAFFQTFVVNEFPTLFSKFRRFSEMPSVLLRIP